MTVDAIAIWCTLACLQTCRRFFVTEAGHLGASPADIQPGDTIVLFTGLDCPFVIRKVEGSDEFRAVGMALVEGLMGVEVWEETEADLKEFCLV